MTDGTYYEKKSLALMEAEGYTVERAYAKAIRLAGGRIITLHHDFFSLFDLICVNKERVVFVQVKSMGEGTHGHLKDVRRLLSAFPHAPGNIELHIWQREGSKANLMRELI